MLRSFFLGLGDPQVFDDPRQMGGPMGRRGQRWRCVLPKQKRADWIRPTANTYFPDPVVQVEEGQDGFPGCTSQSCFGSGLYEGEPMRRETRERERERETERERERETHTHSSQSRQWAMVQAGVGLVH